MVSTSSYLVTGTALDQGGLNSQLQKKTKKKRKEKTRTPLNRAFLSILTLACIDAIISKVVIHLYEMIKYFVYKKVNIFCEITVIHADSYADSLF